MCSFLLLSLFFTVLSVSVADECRGCQAYDCFEDAVHCGNDSYLVKYGGKYCRKFNDPETLKNFSPIGREFVECTTSCLKRFMQNYINNTSRRPPYSHSQCSDLEKAAFGSHVKCYLDCDFCTVCKTEKAALFHVYEFRDFFSWSAMKQMYEVLKSCGGPHACFDLF
ncbi:hypothetical protein QR680_008446 [Steinernema hermaphroditum]|uniref:Uncharacterized protein n=1 Tax=Steinernema hermaphroditum TaxID=289476 RepID=A0AA39IGL6_9BILA|nr:hypothetical protein QR680_008446 [Steinernema hermaphroditum]